MFNSINFFDQGNRLVTSTTRGEALIWNSGLDLAVPKDKWSSEFPTKGIGETIIMELNNRDSEERTNLLSAITPNNHVDFYRLVKEDNVSSDSKYLFKKIGVLKSHSAKINLTKASRDQSLYLTASEDRTIHVYDFSSGFTDSIFLKLVGHSSGIKYANFSPDGRYIISCSKDSTIKIWSIKDKGRLILDLTEEGDNISIAELSSDNQYLLMGTNDGIIKVKPLLLNINKILEAINKGDDFGKVGELTKKQKKRFFADFNE